MSAERIVVLGGDAAGMSAAHQLLREAERRGRAVEVVVLEAGRHTSYSACGVPYWIAGDVASADDLVARTPAEHRAAGIDLRLGVRAVGLDVARGRVLVEHGEPVGFDQLLIATGAAAIVPEWARDDAGRLHAGINVVHNLDDGHWWRDRIATAAPGERLVVAGGGYIGLEMAEAALRRGFRVTLLTRSRVMSNLDPVLSERVVAGLRAAGVEVVEDTTVAGVDLRAGAVTAVRDTAGNSYPCALMVLALGVRPALGFAAETGLPTGPSGALLTDECGQVAPGIWAAGDCCATTHRLTGEPVYLPLGTHATKLGRVVGTNLGGGQARFAGVLGTAITRFVHGGVHLEIGRTGLGETQAREHGIAVQSLVTVGTTASGYMPEAEEIAVQAVAETGSRRLLGMQIVGGAGAGKRIDTAAVALWASMSVDDVAEMDLSYSPPFSTTWEIAQVAVRRLAERMDPAAAP